MRLSSKGQALGGKCGVVLARAALNAAGSPRVPLARQLTTLDVLSKGRLRVGLGVGWNIDELEAAGVPWAERGKRADEALHVLEAIWTTDPVEFHGRYYQLPRSYIGLKPIQQPHPPIYMGAFTPASIAKGVPK
jgi:alkanesulfonate monooxygenase SsuD/methylene tetrahydromethanopterin reductase-like flavin-dependent oxidoreductase (luciferase family)